MKGNILLGVINEMRSIADDIMSGDTTSDKAYACFSGYTYALEQLELINGNERNTFLNFARLIFNAVGTSK